MSTITNISIENVKGFGNPAIVLPIELKTNRINLIFAPNGTGKSSLATAFRSLTSRAMIVAKENKYHKDETLNSSLSFLLDGVLLEANSTNNTISRVINCKIINCANVVHTIQHNMGRYTSVSGYVDIEDIVIEPVVQSSRTAYSIKRIRKEFGVNGKILENQQDDYDNQVFLLKLKTIWELLDKYGKAKARKQLVEDVLSKIQSLNGTSKQILDNIDEQWLSDIEQNPVYSSIVEFIRACFPSETRISYFLRFFQLYIHWNQNETTIKAATDYVEYKERRNKLDNNLKSLDNTWKNIHTEEIDGKLVVQFPRSDEISNGQRDLLTFVVELIKFQTHLRPEKKYLLMIDEVFDYLDDANLIAAQYFLTKFLDITKDNLFLCILSHLNPYTFRSYVFSDKKINAQYLKNTIPCATLKMKDFISFRERMHKEGKNGDCDKETLYHDLSHDLFHYNPVATDHTLRIAQYKNEPHLDERWGNSSVLHQILISEVNQYLSGAPKYDPYAVAMALRLRVEKIMYDKLQLDLKQGFLNEKKTKDKFGFCQNHGIEVLDVYYMVSAIHNDADHLKFDEVSNRYIEKPMVYKLQNTIISQIIKEIFDWKGVSLSTIVIE